MDTCGKSMKFSVAAAMEMVDTKALKAHKIVVFKVLRGVISKSPVDTGTYKSNHKVNSSAHNDNKFGTDKSAASVRAGQEAENEGSKAIALIKTGYQVSTVSNSLPYASVIENGSANRAPVAVYRNALAAAKGSK